MCAFISHARKPEDAEAKRILVLLDFAAKEKNSTSKYIIHIDTRKAHKLMQDKTALNVGMVVTVSCSTDHTFSKQNQERIQLLTGLGVEGDAHLGKTVKHRSRVKKDPTQPNLRQVHLIHAELHEELRNAGFDVSAGDMGENVTTQGIDLLALPTGTHLHLGDTAIVEVTGLRNPCVQLDNFQSGLMSAVLGRDEQGELIRKAGVMGIVLADGEVKPGDTIRVVLPSEPYRALETV
jgi:MOSC domain-containing protein YiiM